jgi:hypothetical protein
MSQTHLSWSDLKRFLDDLPRFRRGLGITSVLLTVLLGAASVLELGMWKKIEIVHGPFKSTGDGSRAFVIRVGSTFPVRALLGPQGDRLASESQSDLELWVNDEAWGPAHTDYDVIRRGETRGYSHWMDRLFFALPLQIGDDANAVLTLKYSIRLATPAFVVLLLSTVTVSLLWVRATPSESLTGIRPALSMLMYIFPGLSWLLVAACSVYGATVLYGVSAGYTLPTATIFRLFPNTLSLAALERSAPFIILLFAAAGATFAWLAALKIVCETDWRRTEIKLMRLWQIWSLPVIAGLFSFSISAGGWAGHVRTTDINYMSLAGLVPHSDARAYFTDAFHQAFWGHWDVLGSRRPLAQAFRQLVVLAAQYSYVGTLLVQLGMLALMTHFVARSLARWRGIWVGIAFVGLLYLLARPFLTTTLTEPLGLLWTLFSMIYFIEALRLQSMQHALIALIGLTFALLSRMGSLFSIPFLMIWLAVAFGEKSKRLRLLAFACAAVLGVSTLNGALGFLYGATSTVTGGNFAWTICGLSVGGYWNSCPTMYAAEFDRLQSERAMVWFLLSKSWDNFLHDPTVLLHMLWYNLGHFAKGLPGFLLSGYGSDRPSVRVTLLAVIAVLPGLYFVLAYRASFAERLLWTVLAVSIPLSAAVVMTDDGWRVLTVTHPLIACFVAFGFAAPATVALRRSPAQWRWKSGALLVAFVSVLFLVVPALSHILARHEIASHPSFVRATRDENVVPGGSRITGFIVIPDGTLAPVATPTLSLSEFVNLIRYTRLEEEFGPFLREVAAEMPFALVSAGRLDGDNQSNIYIAPPVVLERRDVWAWRLTLRQRTAFERPWIQLQQASAAQSVP